MSSHVPTTCNESDGTWLPLIEYSVKTGVSLSTIRRKIKTNSIQYRLEKGRYLILLQDSSETGTQPVQQGVGASSQDVDRWQDKPLSRFNPSAAIMAEPEEGEDRRLLPMVEKAVNMVSDAFEYALVQKEEQIRILEQRNQELEDRVNELKLLVRVIEEKYKVRY